MVPGDENFVLSTILRDLRQADSSGLPDEHWFPAHRAFFQSLFRDRAVAVVIACAADQPREILGYVLARPGEALEWIYVRRPLRRKGLAKRLLAAVRIESSDVQSRWTTPDGRKYLRSRLSSRSLRRAPRPTPGITTDATSAQSGSRPQDESRRDVNHVGPR